MREISTFKKRILQYAEKMGITKYEIYQNTGISNGVFSQKGGLSEDNILKFLSHYTDISPEWFLTGKDPMLKSDLKSDSRSGDRESGELIRELIEKNGELRQKIGELIKENEALEEKIEKLKKGERNKNSGRNSIYSSQDIAAEPEE